MSNFFLYLTVFILGTLAGSFLNVVICRLPDRKSVVKGRSMCPHCKAVIKAYDLIPILSFFLLKRKCRVCSKKISWQYPIVELATGLVFAYLAYYHNGLFYFWLNLVFYRDIVFACALIITFATDLKNYLIFDAVVIPMIFFAFIINVFILGNSSNYWQIIYSLLMGAVLCGGFFLAQYALSKGKWIGLGDVKFGVLMGMMLGWKGVLVALFLAYIAGALVSLFLLAFKLKKAGGEVPFGVFLCPAVFVTMMFQDELIYWYLNIIL